MTFDTQPNKDGRTVQKPATLELNGNHIEATHHITDERNLLLHLYLAGRSTGIDISVPIASDKPAYARSKRGERALGLNTDDDEELSDEEVVLETIDELSDDSRGAKLWDISEELEETDIDVPAVTYDLFDEGVIDEVSAHIFIIGEIDGDGGDGGEDETRLVTDGGYDIPTCACGADPIETADLVVIDAHAPGLRNRREIPAPDVECGECGESIGAVYGTGVVVAIWDALDEPLPGDDSEDGRELVTDGGETTTVATQRGERHDVVYCNYCGSGMSVPMGDIPDDPKCNSCKELENLDDAYEQSRKIRENNPVGVGDRVEYRDEPWIVTGTGPWHTVHLINRSSGIKPYVDVRDVDVVERDAEDPPHPDRIFNEGYWYETEPDIRPDAAETTDNNDGKELVTDGGRDVVEHADEVPHANPLAGETVVSHGDEIGTVQTVEPKTVKETVQASSIDGSTRTWETTRPARLVIDPAVADYTKFRSGRLTGPVSDKELRANEIPVGAVRRCDCGSLTVYETPVDISPADTGYRPDVCCGACNGPCGDESDEKRIMTDGEVDIDDDTDFDVVARAEDAKNDDEQMRIDDFGGRRLLTDGGVEIPDHEDVQDGMAEFDENDEDHDDSTPTTGTLSEWRGNVPESMQEIDRWLMWSGEPDAPRRPHWRGDFSVSYNDPDDWHTFDEAVEAAAEKESWGIGVVTSEDDISVIDLDGCAGEDGSPVDWTPSLGRLRAAYDGDGAPYMDWSPSESGIHIPVKNMDRPDWWTDVSIDDREHEGVDLLQGSFVTVTGVTEKGFNGDVIEHCPEVDFLLQEAKENIEVLNGGPDIVNASGDGWEPDKEWLTEDDIREALRHLDADCSYPKWRNIGFAVAEYFHRGYEEDTDEEAKGRAKGLFESWSRTADSKWDRQAERQVDRIIDDSWDRIDTYDDVVTVGTLIAYAQEAGWDMPAPPQPLDDNQETDWEAIEEERQSITWNVGSDELVNSRNDVVGWAWSRDDEGNKEEITGLTVAEPVDAVDSVYCSVDLVTAKREHSVDASLTTHLKMPHRVERRVVNAEPLHKLAHRLDALYEDCLNAEARSVAVQRILQALEVITVGGQDNKTLYVYDPGTGIYDSGGREVVRAVVESVCPARASDHEKREIVSKIADRTREPESEAFEPRGEFDKEKHDYRVVGNGILRLPTEQPDGSVCDPVLLDYSPELRARKRVPTNYNTDADVRVVSEWLDGMTGREEDRLAIEELVGNVLLPNYRHPKITMLYGSGRNGKGVLLDVTAEMCGGVESTNVAGNSLEDLVENNFRGLKMKNALVNLDGELNGRKLTESEASKLKALTGEEPQEGEDKQVTAETFRNTAKLFHASNSPLLPPETQESWQERWVPIELPFSFVSNPDPDDPMQKPDDKKIKQKMTRQENLEAMLLLAVDGLARLEEQGDVSLPESPEDRLKNYALDADPISRVEVDLLEATRNPSEKAEKYVPKAAVYDGYKSMARGDGVEPIAKKDFFRILEDRMVELPYDESRPRTPDGVDNNRERCLRGVRFSDDAAEYLSEYWLSHPWVQVTDTAEDRYGADDAGDSLSDEREELSIADILSIPRGLLSTGQRVDVTDAALIEWSVMPDKQVYAFATATNVDSDDEMSMVAFDCPTGGDDIGSEIPCYVEIRGAILDAYDEELQLQIDSETTIHVVERADDDQETVDDAADVVNGTGDGGDRTTDTPTTSDGAEAPQKSVATDGGDSTSDAEEIDRAALQHAPTTDSTGALVGRVSASTRFDDLAKIKHRIEKLRERGDIILNDKESDDTDDTGNDDDGALRRRIRTEIEARGDNADLDEIVTKLALSEIVPSSDVKDCVRKMESAGEVCEMDDGRIRLTGGD